MTTSNDTSSNKITKRDLKSVFFGSSVVSVGEIPA